MPAGVADQRGMVTAETAVVLPVLLMVLAGAVAAVVVVGSQLRCVDAAREAARAVARGETAAMVGGLVSRLGPEGARAGLSETGGTVTVTVTAQVRPIGPMPLRVRVSASAVAVREPAAGVAR